jgi:hypothetical protein
MTSKLSIIIYTVLGLCVAYGYIAAGGWTEADTVGATLIAFVGVVMLRDQRRRSRAGQAALAVRERLDKRLWPRTESGNDLAAVSDELARLREALATATSGQAALTAEELHGIELALDALDAEHDPDARARLRQQLDPWSRESRSDV